MIPFQTYDEVLQMFACKAMPGDLVTLRVGPNNTHDFHVSVWAHLEDGDYTVSAVLTPDLLSHRVPETIDLWDPKTGLKTPVKVTGVSLHLSTSGPVTVGVSV